MYDVDAGVSFKLLLRSSFACCTGVDTEHLSAKSSANLLSLSYEESVFDLFNKNLALLLAISDFSLSVCSKGSIIPSSDS